METGATKQKGTRKEPHKPTLDLLHWTQAWAVRCRFGKGFAAPPRFATTLFSGWFAPCMIAMQFSAVGR